MDHSMGWTPMQGQTWLGAGASFLAMWTVMMVVMMLPALVPMLGRYRRAVGRGSGADRAGTGEPRLGRWTAVAALGYFTVWTALGAALYPPGAALASLLAERPALTGAAPIAVGVVVLLAGCLQLTPWKARQLRCCREAPGPGRALPAGAGTAWRHGLRLGRHCVLCCAGQMAVLLALGVMDLRAMIVVTAAIAAERLLPAGERVARATGLVAVAAGLLLIARATGLV